MRILAATLRSNVDRVTHIFAGHEVAFAFDYREAYKAAENGNFDLIAVNVAFDESGGFDLLRHFKRSGICQQTPVVMVVRASKNSPQSAARLAALEVRAKGVVNVVEQPDTPEGNFQLLQQFVSLSKPSAG